MYIYIYIYICTYTHIHILLVDSPEHRALIRSRVKDPHRLTASKL